MVIDMTVAVYLRISEDDQERALNAESESIANQRNIIKDFMRQKPEFDCADYVEYIEM